jgi:hypothetical protein
MAYDDRLGTEAAYYGAIDAYRMENARKSRQAKWLSEADHSALVDFMSNSSNEFVQKLFGNYMQWGGLTENQCVLVRNAMEKQAQWKAAKEAKGLLSQHVGTVGKRQDFSLSVTFMTGYESTFGYVNVIGFIDDNNNVYVYKGSTRPECSKGDNISFKATIKEHSVRENVKQTILSRPVWNKK